MPLTRDTSVRIPASLNGHSTTRPAASRAPHSDRATTPAVAICDGSADFASDRYDANSAARYDANLDANTQRPLLLAGQVARFL